MPMSFLNNRMKCFKKKSCLSVEQRTEGTNLLVGSPSQPQQQPQRRRRWPRLLFNYSNPLLSHRSPILTLQGLWMLSWNSTMAPSFRALMTTPPNDGWGPPPRTFSFLALTKDTNPRFIVRWRKMTTLSSLGQLMGHWKFGTQPLANVSTLFSCVIEFTVCWKRTTTLVLFVDWAVEQLRWDKWVILVSSPLSTNTEIMGQLWVYVSWKMVRLWVQQGGRWRDGMTKEECFKPSLDT